MLNDATWDSRFGKLAVGTAVIRIGWFSSLDPALFIATTHRGDQVDLLVVSPQTVAPAAERAMAMAADPTNVMRAPDILAATSAPPVAVAGNGRDPNAVWDNEGGSTAAGGPHRATNQLPTAHSR